MQYQSALSVDLISYTYQYQYSYLLVMARLLPLKCLQLLFFYIVVILVLCISTIAPSPSSFSTAAATFTTPAPPKSATDRLNFALDAVWTLNSAAIKGLSAPSTLQSSTSHFRLYRASTTCSRVYQPCGGGSGGGGKGGEIEAGSKKTKKKNKNDDKTNHQAASFLGCCKSQELMYLYNVHISFVDFKVLIFDGSASFSFSSEDSKCSSFGGTKIPFLPSLVTENDINLNKKHLSNAHRHNSTNSTVFNINYGTTQRLQLDYSSSIPSNSKSKLKYESASHYCQSRTKESAKTVKSFHGTVHVIGAHTVGNLFHALNDNIIPVLSLFILDKYFNSDFLRLPRILVLAPGASLDRAAVPHLKILKDLFIEVIPWSDMKELCATRVVWGSYLRPFYNPSAAVLNRLSTDLLRELALSYFPVMPTAFTSSESILRSSTTTSSISTSTSVVTNKQQQLTLPFPFSSLSNTSFNMDKSYQPRLLSRNTEEPLRIAIFSRGSHGQGRSIAGESVLASALTAFGAKVAICADFKSSSMMEQLGFALYADVIIGLHGAGLANFAFSPVNSILLELKTIYGYNLDLFALVSSSRSGFHVEIDVRDYFVYKHASDLSTSSSSQLPQPRSQDAHAKSNSKHNSANSQLNVHLENGGHMPFDKPLISRVINGLLIALREKSTKSVYTIKYAGTTATATKRSSSSISNANTNEYVKDKDTNPNRLTGPHINDIIMTPSVYFNTSWINSPGKKMEKGVVDDAFLGQSIFGPKIHELHSYCNGLPLSHYRDLIGAKMDLYCQGCEAK